MQRQFLSTEIDGAMYYECQAPDGLQVSEGIDRPEGVAALCGQRGQLVYWIRPGQTTWGFDPPSQIWIPAAALGDQPCGRYWIGFDRRRPPTPAELARPYLQPGVEVTLNDGQQWLLPKASQLPKDLILADDGTWRNQLQRKFWSFVLESQHWLQVLAKLQPGDPYDFAALAEFLRKALAINYRMLPEVISHLRLFTTENVHPLAAHVILSKQLSAPTPTG